MEKKLSNLNETITFKKFPRFEVAESQYYHCEFMRDGADWKFNFFTQEGKQFLQGFHKYLENAFASLLSPNDDVRAEYLHGVLRQDSVPGENKPKTYKASNGKYISDPSGIAGDPNAGESAFNIIVKNYGYLIFSDELLGKKLFYTLDTICQQGSSGQ